MIGGGLIAGAGAAQAQGVAGGYAYGPGASSSGYVDSYYGYTVRPDAINPGASYGINSTEAGAAGATIGGTAFNSSSQSEMMPGAVTTGRAATYGAPPMEEDVEPY
jgi:hypothetical protein